MASTGPTPEVAERIERIERAVRPATPVGSSAAPPPGISEHMERFDVPGIGIAVINDGRIEWARGYGVRDAERGWPVEVNTRFQAASISKPIAALAALRLVEEGRLDLDADINEYLTSWQVPANDGWQPRITLRQLLSHSAGLTVHGFPGYRRDHAIPSVIQILNGEAPANTGPVRVENVPGTQFRYSGGGYTILQLLLTDLTGIPFPDLMRTLVLDPAGMVESAYAQPLPESLAGSAASAHRTGGGVVAGGWHVYPEMAAAGLWTTPSDLCRLAVLLQQTLSGQAAAILSPAMLGRMLEPQAEPHMGLGFRLAGEGSGAHFGHTGGNEGFCCELVAYRAGGFGAVVMTNSDTGFALVKDILRAIAAEYGWPDYLPAERQAATVDLNLLDRYAGIYELRPNFPLVVTRSGRSLLLEVPGQAPLQLLPESNDIWFVPTLAAAVCFTADQGTGAGALILRQNDREMRAMRIG